jgi:creatinine amidohydrolase/Fe(II)-dependent formamide hydrolase-like protein
MRSLKLEELHWPEVKQALQNGYDTVAFGVGATEQHGPHMPLACDSLIGEALAMAVAKKLGNTLVAPTIRVGCSEHHMAFPGTMSIDSETLTAILVSYTKTLVSHGFHRILIIPSHGGNFKTVADTVPLLCQQFPDKAIMGFADLQRIFTVTNQVSKRFGISAEASGIHAGEFETSLLLSLHPDLIDMSLAEKGWTGNPQDVVPKILADGVMSVSRNGVLGDARLGDASRGPAYLASWVDLIVDEVTANKVVA